MLFLLLSVLSSVGVAMILKLHETRRGSRSVLIAANYIVASAANLCLWWIGGWSALSLDTMALGVITGVLYIVAFVLMIVCIGAVGVSITVPLTRLAVVLPILVSIIFYSERPTMFHVTGMILAGAAFFLFGKSNSERKAGEIAHARQWLLLGSLFLCMGANAISLKVFAEHMPAKQMAGFLTVLFATAGVIAWLWVICRTKAVNVKDFSLGLCLGVPNCLSSLFLLLALAALPAVFAFLTNEIGVVVLSTAAAMLIWREKLNRTGWSALAVAVVAIFMMNIQMAEAGVSNCMLGQGQMAGEVSQSSVILQSRLTTGNVLIDGDIEGHSGKGRFELAATQDFAKPIRTQWLEATGKNDFIIKTKVKGLKPATRYYYRLLYRTDDKATQKGQTCTFRTLGGAAESGQVRIAVVTGMNYGKFHVGARSYKGEDKHLGYPGLVAILKKKADFFVGTGDNVYFDYPGGKAAARTEAELRKKYHEQFIQPRYIDLFAKVPTYWEKDDHDHRYNDCDNTGDRKPSPELGTRIFKEQLPVADPADAQAVTYRTYRINKDLQIWLVEGRDYRSPNRSKDEPGKTIWGDAQKQWLKRTLLDSDATFKILISATPMIGPDDAYKKDNHTNVGGFQHEGREFFKWLKENGFDKKNFYFICGDRHWQYHSIDPSGFEEFSCGALVDANSRVGRRPGDPKSTDPDAGIKQPYCMQKPSGGFLLITITPGENQGAATAKFDLCDEQGVVFYSHTKQGK